MGTAGMKTEAQPEGSPSPGCHSDLTKGGLEELNENKDSAIGTLRSSVMVSLLIDLTISRQHPWASKEVLMVARQINPTFAS
jgi:hypothetical protein